MNITVFNLTLIDSECHAVVADKLKHVSTTRALYT